MSADDLASPCIGVCAYDEALGWCSGCGRTLDEIGAWPGADAARKGAILEEAAARSGTAWRARVIPAVAHELAPLLQARIDENLKPLGAFGRLEEFALQLGLIQHSVAPVLRRPGIVLFGDGVERLAEFARLAGVELRHLDQTAQRGIGRWLDEGAAQAAWLAQDGFDAIVPVVGGCSTADKMAESLIGLAAGPDAGRRALDLVAASEARGLAMAAGAMIESAVRRCLVVVDGQAVLSALFAVRLAPGLANYLVFADRPAEPLAQRALTVLGARPLLDLQARFPPGVGAALAWPMLAASAFFLRDMATDQSLGITHRNPLA